MSSSAARYFPRALGDPAPPNHDINNANEALSATEGEKNHHNIDRSGKRNSTVDPSTSTSDEALLALIREDDKEALALLFRRYASVVRGLAYRVLRDASEADDLLQDIFLLVHRLCGTFDNSKGPARFWILQMTYRRAISRRRYLTCRHFYSHLDLDQAANRVDDASSKSGRRNSVDGALERQEAWQSWLAELSESQRQTLHLFFFEGYTFDEIATHLGQTVGNARNHYYRGLQKLRKQISAGRLPGKEAV
jgi:RNA polymerase sigma-70 factor (ECF subfamily)